MREHWQHYIAGGWVDGVDRDVIDVHDPSTGLRFAGVARATAGDVERAVAAARTCVSNRSMIAMRPSDRGRKLLEVAAGLRLRGDELARLITLDSGKNIDQARDEVEGSARYFEFYGGLADKLEGKYIPLGDGLVDFVIPTPYGVSAHVIPWNYPLEMPARSVAPALAAGNAVVIKAPELDPLAAVVLAEIIHDVGLPPGAVNVITGYGHDAGASLVSHPDVDQIVFTGSVATGRSVLHAAAESIVPAVMELGGKSAGVVFADADLDAVTESIRWGIYLNSGQACNAMSRLIVQRDIVDEVVDRAIHLTESLTIGPGIDGHFITPLISSTQQDRVERLVNAGTAEGARAATGGRRVDRDGHFFHPTVFADVTPDMTVATNEIFGPVLSLLTFGTEAEAVSIANSTEYGLAAGVFTRDLDRALLIAERLEAGQVYVNEWYAGGVETPFGGFKHSGFGREKGVEALANYYQSKNVGIRQARTALEGEQ